MYGIYHTYTIYNIYRGSRCFTSGIHLDSCQHTISYVGHTISYNSYVDIQYRMFWLKILYIAISYVKTYDIVIRHRILGTYDIRVVCFDIRCCNYDIVCLTYNVLCNIWCRMFHIWCSILQIVCDIVCCGQHIVCSSGIPWKFIIMVYTCHMTR